MKSRKQHPVMILAKWFVLLLVIALVLALSLLHYTYWRNLDYLPDDTRPTTNTYNMDLQRAVWIATEGSGKIQMEPLSPIGYLLAWLAIAQNFNENQRSLTFPPGMYIASLNAKQLIRRDNPERLKMMDWHLANAAITIWVTRHWSTNEAINSLLDTAYFGHDYHGIEAAAAGYFNTTAEKLSLDEITLIMAMEKSPTMYDPWCEPERALKRINWLQQQLSTTWPEYYPAFVELNFIPPRLKPAPHSCKS